jgi:hypothetical protein
MFNVDSRHTDVSESVTALLSCIKTCGATFPLTLIHHVAHSAMFIAINIDINARPIRSYRRSDSRTNNYRAFM